MTIQLYSCIIKVKIRNNKLGGIQMKKFIRLDMKGHWRGKEHVSSVMGMGEEFDMWEKGISCYELDDKAYALDQLRNYWFDMASITVEDLEGMQVTIFEGYKVDGMGGDWEDLAVCEKTLAEFDAKDFMLKIQELYELKEYDEEITEEEYEQRLNKIELPI